MMTTIVLTCFISVWVGFYEATPGVDKKLTVFPFPLVEFCGRAPCRLVDLADNISVLDNIVQNDNEIVLLSRNYQIRTDLMFEKICSTASHWHYVLNGVLIVFGPCNFIEPFIKGNKAKIFVVSENVPWGLPGIFVRKRNHKLPHRPILCKIGLYLHIIWQDVSAELGVSNLARYSHRSLSRADRPSRLSESFSDIDDGFPTYEHAGNGRYHHQPLGNRVIPRAKVSYRGYKLIDFFVVGLGLCVFLTSLNFLIDRLAKPRRKDDRY